MKSLVLFDVDGTLTKSRLTIEQPMIDTLEKLSKIENLDLGIVGGSNLKKQKEQLLEKNFHYFKYLFSENGLVGFKDGELINKTSIVDALGEDNIKRVINTSLRYMSTLDIPVKRGTFIEFRNGMINLCPVGRSCTLEERMEFYDYDNKHNIRKNMVEYLNKELLDLNMQFSIGGQISIDAFPKGWDKTYCLQFVENDYDKIYFFGDKIHPGGNDYEIGIDPRTHEFKVTNPNDTIKFLSEVFNI
tara:strand:- start:326 stop:1060 length:735 start_codon:yes stop_codon:yes gene_type:complete